MGSSSNTAYVESSAGVSEGARTRFNMRLIVSGLFLVGMLFVPLAYFIPSAATAPALIIVGFFMITMINKINWDNFEEALPAFSNHYRHDLYFQHIKRYWIWIHFILYN